MELSCIEGPAGTGKEKLILPNKMSLENLSLFTNHFETNQFLNKDNIKNAKQVNNKRIDEGFDISEIADSAISLECVEEKFQFFMGEGEKKLFVGPVLQVIGRSTYSLIIGNKYIHFDKSPLNEKGNCIHAKDREIAITPANEDGKDFLIVIFKSGCIIVAAGGYLVFKLPVVVVKSNGNYLTISDAFYPRTILQLKKGIHIILYTKLDSDNLPLVLSRGTLKLRGLESEKPLEIQLEKPSVKPKVMIEKIDLKVNELPNNEYIPISVVQWINGKGYELESILGMSTYSMVRGGKRISDSMPIALKIIISDKDQLVRRSEIPPQEIILAKKVDHQNIVKTFDIFCALTQTDKKYDTLFSLIVMELGTSDTLEKLIKREGKMTEDKAKQVFKQIASAVDYLHNNFIAHCFIRPDNCLIFDNNVIKLCDFSRAENVLKKVDGQRFYRAFFRKYMPPEVFGSGNCDLLKLDIWMSACLLYTLLTANFSPFGDIDREDKVAETEALNKFQKHQKEGLPKDANISDRGKDLLSKMFKSNPNHRINVKQVLAHEWLK
jgi:hypothetical protein